MVETGNGPSGAGDSATLYRLFFDFGCALVSIYTVEAVTTCRGCLVGHVKLPRQIQKLIPLVWPVRLPTLTRFSLSSVMLSLLRPNRRTVHP